MDHKRKRRRRKKPLLLIPRRKTVGEFTRSRRHSISRSEQLRQIARRLAVPALLLLILLSLFMITNILLRTLHTRRLNAQLAQLRSEQPVSTPAPTAIPATLFVETPLPEAAEASTVIEAFDLTPASTQAPAQTQGERIFHRVGGTPLANMETLYNQNHDLVAWIEIPDVISLPIVYRDNTYYLTHDFNRNKSTAGTLFLDKNHRFTEHTQNLLLHGHNMKDGTMFGRLVQYIHNLDFYKNNAFVRLDTLWEQEEYVMFAVLRVPLDVRSEKFVNYFSHPTFASDRAFESYVRQLQLASVYAIPIDVEPSDMLLTLSTCLDDDRLVIVCRRLRQGESRSHLRELVRSSTRQ